MINPMNPSKSASYSLNYLGNSFSDYMNNYIKQSIVHNYVSNPSSYSNFNKAVNLCTQPWQQKISKDFVLVNPPALPYLHTDDAPGGYNPVITQYSGKDGSVWYPPTGYTPTADWVQGSNPWSIGASTQNWPVKGVDNSLPWNYDSVKEMTLPAKPVLDAKGSNPVYDPVYVATGTASSPLTNAMGTQNMAAGSKVTYAATPNTYGWASAPPPTLYPTVSSMDKSILGTGKVEQPWQTTNIGSRSSSKVSGVGLNSLDSKNNMMGSTLFGSNRLGSHWLSGTSTPFNQSFVGSMILKNLNLIKAYYPKLHLL